MALNQVPLKTISNVNKTSCSLYCTVHRDCYYFNLQRNTGTCELLEFITDPSYWKQKLDGTLSIQIYTQKLYVI